MTGPFAAFLGISLIVIVTPGPDTALTIRNTLLGGRKTGNERRALTPIVDEMRCKSDRETSSNTDEKKPVQNIR